MKHLSDKPYYSTVTIIILPLLVLCANKFLGFLIGRDVIANLVINSIFHFIGGLTISLSAAGVLWHLVRLNILRVDDSVVFRLLVIGTVCFAVISWEIYEYVVVYPNSPEFVGYIDTIRDMFIGLAGGVFALILIRPLFR